MQIQYNSWSSERFVQWVTRRGSFGPSFPLEIYQQSDLPSAPNTGGLIL